MKNVESDARANIDSDHCPVITKLKIKLKAIQNAAKHRPKYGICTEQTKNDLNEKLRALREKTDNPADFT